MTERSNRRAIQAGTPTVCLSLHGPARLDVGGRTIRVQRKGLALLYVLAMDGPTRRERIADLLWGHAQALRNLRVELHGLRKALSAHGIAAFDRAEDPLVLPDAIRLDRTERPGEVMEGLEDLSREFQAWLEEKRLEIGDSDAPEPVFADVVHELAEAVRVPYVLILEGLPFSGRADLARTLATRMDLPFREGTDAVGRGLRYVPEGTTFARELVDRIVADRRGLWVIERPAFGEDPFLVLALRERYPAERMRYVRVGALGWRSLRTQRLAGLPFAEAAQIYLESGGQVGYVDELLAIRPEGGFGGYVPVPRRVKAGFQMEARRLAMEARFALGRLSIHPGTIPEPVLDGLDVVEHLPELERRRWIRFDGRWSFVDDVARALAYEVLQPGQRLLAHRRAAEMLEAAGQSATARYHRWCAAGRDRTADPFAELREPFRPTRARVRPAGSYRALEPVAVVGDVTWHDDRLWVPASEETVRLGRVAFDLPPEPTVVRVRGAVERSGPLVSTGFPTALELAQGASDVPTIRLIGGDHDGLARDGAWELTHDREVDLLLYLPYGGRLALGTRTPGMVATLTVEAARVGAVEEADVPIDSVATGERGDVAVVWRAEPADSDSARGRGVAST